MNRVVASNVSAYFENEHRKHGVDIHCNMRLIRLEGSGRVKRAVCADGKSFDADVVIAGIGAVPRTELAEGAGLVCANGIVVDERCQTSHERIFAAGDCANHPSRRFGMRVRLESVDNAVEQAKVAAQAMLGLPAIHDSVPWFWSDQYDNKLLIAGLSFCHDLEITRGNPASRSFSVCYLKDGELIAVEAVNHIPDHIASRALVARRHHLDPYRLSDPNIPLKAV